MKKNLAITLITLLPAISFADSSNCSFQDVHCSYVTNGSNAKTIRVDTLINGQPQKSYWTCVNEKTAITIAKWEVEYGYYSVGQHITIKYSQCADRDCKRNVDLGTEEFYIEKNSDNDYYSTPFTYPIRLIPNFGNNCTPR